MTSNHNLSSSSSFVLLPQVAYKATGGSLSSCATCLDCVNGRCGSLGIQVKETGTCDLWVPDTERLGTAVKHLQGKHNQAMHGYRFSSGAPSLARARQLRNKTKSATRDDDPQLEVRVIADKETLEDFKMFLAQVAHNAHVGHSAHVGFFVDGDGYSRFSVSGFDLAKYEKWLNEAPTGDYEFPSASGGYAARSFKEVSRNGRPGTGNLLETAKHLQGKHNQAAHGGGGQASLFTSGGGAKQPQGTPASAAKREQYRKELATVIEGQAHRAGIQARADIMKNPDYHKGNPVFGGGKTIPKPPNEKDIKSAVSKAIGEKLSFASYGGNKTPTFDNKAVRKLVTGLVERSESSRALHGLFGKGDPGGMSAKQIADLVTKQLTPYLDVPATPPKARQLGLFGTKEINGLTVFKDKNGRSRWLAISSNAYRDRDGEIVSMKALRNDVARADKDGRYGTLRFWHMPGVDIGDCDFNMMHGRMLIESGTFKNETIAQKVAEKSKDYQVSIGFRHPHNEPDKDGVYHNIRRFERSLVPKGRVANPFTSFTVKERKDKMATLEEKTKALQALMDDPDIVNGILSLANQTQKEADDQGYAYKEQTDLNELSPVELLDVAIKQYEAWEAEEFKAKKAPAVEVSIESEEEDDMEEDMDMEPETKGKGPMKEYKMADIGKRMDEMYKMMQDFTATKKEYDAPMYDTLSAIGDAQIVQADRQDELETRIKELEERLEVATKALEDATGNVPPALANGYRATQSDQTVTAEATAVKSANGHDPDGDMARFERVFTGFLNSGD